MFSGHEQTYTRLEFWWTDEFGTRVNFQNVAWSITLAVMYRQ
jgi:hypothetical protein